MTTLEDRKLGHAANTDPNHRKSCGEANGGFNE